MYTEYSVSFNSRQGLWFHVVLNKLMLDVKQKMAVYKNKILFYDK